MKTKKDDGYKIDELFVQPQVSYMYVGTSNHHDHLLKVYIVFS